MVTKVMRLQFSKVFCTRVFTSRFSKKLHVCEKSIYENESLEAVAEKIYSEVI